ncbi:MAG: DUF423 domain-containing protein [Rhizobiaceae bacterium]|nr:DUF423 domain-containing protein [Rhizobiaceae bacterium]
MPHPVSPALLFAGGINGALGVALSAVAAHAGGPNLGVAASLLLAHAPALLALSLVNMRVAALAGYGLVLGLLLFCGDLVTRDLLGQKLFPMAAPAGGIVLIAAWLAVAVSALPGRRART